MGSVSGFGRMGGREFPRYGGSSNMVDPTPLILVGVRDPSYQTREFRLTIRCRYSTKILKLRRSVTNRELGITWDEVDEKQRIETRNNSSTLKGRSDNDFRKRYIQSGDEEGC